MSASRGEVLRLYRAILRRGDSLKYTDRDFFRRTIRLEFRKCSRDTELEVMIARNIEVNVHLNLVHYLYICQYFFNRKLNIS